MSQADVASVEALARKKGATPLGILKDIAAARVKQRLRPLSESAVRRVLRGEAYQRGKVERRGRPKKATPKVVAKFNKTLAKLRKKAKSTYRVTYKMVLDKGGLASKISTRRIQPAAMKDGTEWHPARLKPGQGRLG